MTAIVDAGALIAIESGDRRLAAQLKAWRQVGAPAATHGGVVAQVWRGDRRQQLLAIALNAIEVVPLDRSLGRTAGVLLATSGMSDAIDAALVAMMHDGDVVYTSDPDDIVELLEAAGIDADVVPI